MRGRSPLPWWQMWGCVVVGVFATVTPAQADLYRCHLSDGRTAYQQVPCSSGRQIAIDEREAQARQNAETKMREERERSAMRANAERERQAALELEAQRRAAAMREEEKRESEGTRKEWASCAAKRSCDNKCYAVGAALANVYLANQRQMLEYGFSASQYMNDGCQKQARPGGDSCVLLCQDSFKDEIRQLGRR